MLDKNIADAHRAISDLKLQISQLSDRITHLELLSPLARLQYIVCNTLNISLDQFRSQGRSTGEISDARCIFVYFAHQKYSLNLIGEFLGKDHTSIMYQRSRYYKIEAAILKGKIQEDYELRFWGEFQRVEKALEGWIKEHLKEE